MKFQKNILLKNYTTFKIGGKAKYFFAAKTKEDLIEAINLAKKKKLPFFILGGGSNLLVSDKGFNGLIIKTQNTKYKILNTKIVAEAGTMLAELVNVSLKKNLSDVEWAAGIPGTVGGAVYGNAGAFGSSMANIIKTVEALEIQNSKIKIKIFENKDCRFGYRDSVFKKNKNLIILSAMLQLKKGNKKEIESKIKENLNYRKERQPLNFPSAGSVFKNPRLRQGFGGQGFGFSAGKLGEENKSSSSRLAAARLGEENKFSSLSFAAARMIEECGLKGKKVGNVKISEKHANFIVNLGGGKAKDVIKLIKIIKNNVKKKFGVVLEEEVQFL